MELQEWINLHKLDAFIESNVCSIGDEKFLILQKEETELLFDQDLDFKDFPTEQQLDIFDEIGSTNVVFKFGRNWYYSNSEQGAVRLNIFKYIGQAKTSLDYSFPYLGIHGEYDLCNGSRLYKDWCKKAKFFNSPSLAICENNTLAGTLSFQLACKEAGIKSILGETVTVKYDEGDFKMKLYCMNEKGWKNLLNINAQIKVFNETQYVDYHYLQEKAEGLICVIESGLLLNDAFIDNFKVIYGDNLYYQLDFVEWLSADKEKEYLENVKSYIDNFLTKIKPVLICDSFYLDKDHGHIKKILNSIGKVRFQNQSKDQYFKSLEDIYQQLEELAPNEEWMDGPFFQALENTTELSDKCNFQIKLGELHLPKYEMTQEEQAQFQTNEDLFFNLISQGLDRIEYCAPEEEYLKRVEREIDLISRGGFIDYFLITWDILNWCRKNDILCPMGRGSAAGSLVSYLLNITQLDPIKYNLLFERFLSEARILSSMPDIDNDLPSDRREEVKRYMENRYGINYVTSIGTYGTLKIKSGLSDLCREYNFDLKQTKYITSIIEDDVSFTDFFKLALKTPAIKKFIQDYPHIIEDYPLIMDQVKTSSVHAAGVIIVPKEYNGESMTIYDWLPVKKIDGVLVTEWEGPQVEKAGYLKTDILGVRQLQKLAEIFKLIELNHNEKIEFKNIPLDDKEVYRLFQDGSNEDVFQLGAPGLKGYCRELKPEGIEDLIATLALYRPGPMESGAHKDYIKIKNGEKEPEYDYMLEGVTKHTHSKYIYQEQIMEAVQVLGGFTLVEAEEVRSAMGKKIVEKMDFYKIQFIEGAQANGCSEYEAIMIWNKLEVFAGYAFNRSHSACYAHIGYYCQWVKSHFPLEFWSVTLNHSEDKNIARRIAEMHKISNVKVLPPDINQSTEKFEADREQNVIFWSIGSIKQIGEKTLDAILKEKEKNGKFFSFDEFYDRVEKRTVNKRCIVNLILAGCFDKIEKLTAPSQRLGLLKRFVCDIAGDSLSEEFSNSSENWKDYFWILKQKELTGFGYLEFDKIYKSTIFPKIKNSKLRYVDAEVFQDEKAQGDNKGVVGTLSEVIERKMRNKPGSFAEITLNCNDENIICLIWSEIWPTYKALIEQSKNKIICITGKIQFDDKFKHQNVLQTTDKTEIIIL